MRRAATGGWTLLAIAVAVAGAACALVGRGQESTPKRRNDAEKQVARPTPLYYGVAACAECHNGPPKNNLLCPCTELPIWRDKDKHQLAFLVLKNERGQRMAKNLDMDVTKPKAGCIRCHGVETGDTPRHESFSIEEGVSCVVCHGAFKEWVNYHGLLLERQEWRAHSPKTKKEQFGMTDLWDPATRTNLCVSCHVGNAEEGKFVTHAMYAAGHPPLPGIEVATFSEQMPHHWQYLRDKSPEILKSLRFDRAAVQFERLRLVAISSLATLRESMTLLAAQADRCASAKEADDKVLDLANFDCYACHHDLRSSSGWRQRRYVGTPGRPQMRTWSVPLAKITLEVMKGDEAVKSLDAGLKNVYAAFSMQPFGSCPEIATAARALASQLEQWIAELAKPETHYDQTTAARYLRQLCSIGEQATPDYDGARQIAWAFETIYEEWKPNSTDKDPRVTEVIGALKRDLKLELPKRAAGAESTGESAIEKDLPNSLSKIYEYDPETLKKGLRKLSELLPAK